jgi:hypothetical protein
MSDPKPSIRIEVPNLQEMLGRLILALVSVGAFVALGLWMAEGALLEWFSTLLVITVSLLVSAALRGNRLDGSGKPRGGRFAPLLGSLGEHPWTRILTTDLALRIGGAISIGLLVASAERFIAAQFPFGTAPMVSGLISLAAVLIPLYTLMNFLQSRHTYATSEWWQEVKSGALIVLPEQARAALTAKRSALQTALIGATGRTSLSLILRAVAIAVLPLIFSSPFAIAFFGLVAVAIVIGGDALVSIVRHVSSTAIPQPRTEVDDENTRS